MIATTIEQSKKLFELGIDTSTADMFWLVTREPHLHVLGNESLSNYDRWEHYPAWSLSALMKLLPSNIDGGLNEKLHFGLSKGINGKYTIYYGESNIEKKGTLIDAAFEMICLLKENKKI